ncbi:MAG TPA: aromatic aminobenezylarsenical efflux permease ArsG family transporter, partial [Candidatus Brocadiia bacterium]|nr:aromatic aminobenezylarsenical efflux permease ArsG family transporter [Candidatus Brocadiia bacterium]
MSWQALAAALWLGVLTSISPCPLASNIAAISFISRSVGSVRRSLLSGLLYTLGRTAAYVALGAVVMGGLMASGDVARFLQKYLNQILGPVLIVAGMLLLGMLGSAMSMNLAGAGVQQKASKGGAWWALALGALFALSFCPVSAGLYFGGLIPLSLKAGSWMLLPTLYGVGTALPVIVFAFLMAFSAQSVGKAFNKLALVERWVRTVTGAVFIVAGVYY